MNSVSRFGHRLNFFVVLLLMSVVLPIVPQHSALAVDVCNASGPSYIVTICIIMPDDGSSAAGTITVSATASVSGSSTNVRRLEFFLGGNYLLTDFQSPYTFQLNTTRWIDGEQTLAVRALMNDGFVSQQTTISLTFNNGLTVIPPIPTTFQPRTGTTPAPGAPLTLAAAGDGASGELNAKLVTDLMASWNPNMVLYLGDVYEKGTMTEFDNWYGLGNQFFGRFRDITNPVIGNHEYENGVAPGYFGYWGNPPNYYSVDAGGWHFIQLDSTTQFGQRGVNSPQYNWLMQDLQTSTATCTMVSFHHPVFSVGPQGSTEEMMEIWDLLYDYGVDIVLTGHDHSYQRWVPLDGSGNPSSTGITEFVVGASGHGVQGFVSSDSRLAAGNDSPVTGRGALRLNLNPDGAGFEYVNISGQVLDSGSVPCHGVDDFVPPTDPTNLIATSATGREVALEWDASIDNVGVAGYEIYRDSNLLTTSPGPGAHFTDTTVEALTSYTYQVRAFDSAGNFSGFSNELSVATPALEPLFLDGFESGSLFLWSYVNGLTVQSGDVLGGVYAAQAASSGSPAYSKWSLTAPEFELYYKLNFKIVSQGNNSVYLLKFRTSTGTSLFGLNVNSNGTLGYRNDFIGMSKTSSTTVSIGQWHDVQVRLRIAGSSSETEVWLNGERIDSLSNIESMGTTAIGEIQLGENSFGRSFDISFDDVVLGTAMVQSSDVTPPETAIDTGPQSLTMATDADFTFSSSEPGSTFECSLDGANFSACSSPQGYQGLADGPHTFEVMATDAAGNIDPTPASYSWSIDNTAPTTPANVDATAQGFNQVDLDWDASTDNNGVAGYTVYRDSVEIGAINGSSTGYSDTTVVAGTTYTYTVDAIDEAGNRSQQSSAAQVTTPAPPSEVIFYPTDDAYVHANLPNTNFGSSAELRTDASPDIRSYILFDVQGLSGPPGRATLRLHADNSSSFGIDIHMVDSTSWNENTITYNSAPALGAIVASSGPYINNAWVEVDVTSLVTGNGLISLAFTTVSTTNTKLDSKEIGNPGSPSYVLRPQLVINTQVAPPDTEPPSVPQNLQATVPSSDQVDLSWDASTDNTGVESYILSRDGFELVTVDGSMLSYSDQSVSPNTTYSYTVEAIDAAGNLSGPSSPPTPATTPGPGGGDTIILEPVADSYVDGAQPARNFGNSSRLRTDGSPDIRSYLKFDVPAVAGTITSVTLRVQAASNLDNGSGVSINPVTDTSWEEGNITYASAPVVGSPYQMVSTPIVTDGWLEFDLTAVVGTSGWISFALTSTNNTALSLYSRQSGSSSSPSMVITTSDGNDTTPPQTTIDSGPLFLTAATDADFSFSSNEPGSSFECALDGATFSACVSPQQYNGLAEDQHTFQVRATDSFGNTDPTPASHSWTIDSVPPTAPTNVIATVDGATQIDLSWDASTDSNGVTGYTIYRDSIEIASVSGASTAFSDMTVFANTTYSYTVEAIDAAGNLSGPSSPPTPATTPGSGGSDTIKLEPVADSYVDGAQPARNFGNSSRLRTDGSPDIRSYLKFNVPAVAGTITSVTLRVQAASNLNNGFGVSVNPVADNSWDEGNITYASAPVVGSPFQMVSTPIVTDGWLEFDLTAIVGTPGLISFALTSANNTALSLYSRQSGSSSSPQLVIEYDLN